MECRRGVHETERNPVETEGARVGRKGRLVLVVFLKVYFPVHLVGIQRGEDLGVPQGVVALVHPGQWVRIADRPRIKLAVVHAKTQRPSGLRGYLYMRVPIALCGLYDPLLQQSLYLVTDKCSQGGAGAKRALHVRPGSGIEAYRVLYYVNLTEDTVPKAVIAGQHLSN